MHPITALSIHMKQDHSEQVKRAPYSFWVEDCELRELQHNFPEQLSISFPDKVNQRSYNLDFTLDLNGCVQHVALSSA